MDEVLEQYQTFCSDENVDILVQKASMQEKEREEFLDNFHNVHPGSLLGFCVMGGIFGEGIDLTGEKLIGAVIVGTGLPQVNSERELLKNYYDRKESCGLKSSSRREG